MLPALGLKRNRVKREIFELSDLEYMQLNTEYPRGKGSGLIGNRSEPPRDSRRLFGLSQAATATGFSSAR